MGSTTDGRETVVRSARFRWICAPALLAILVAGCAPPGGDAEEAPTAVRGLDMSAEMVESTGTVVLPLDRLRISFLEADLITTAGSVAMSDCLAERGVTFSPPPPVSDPVYLSEQYFGPWTTDQARRFGFVLPMSNADLAANGIVGAPPLSSDQGAERDFQPLPDDAELAAHECADEVIVGTYDTALIDVGPWSTAVDAIPDQVLQDAGFQRAIAELGTCMEAAGLKPNPDEPWNPMGARGDTISAAQIDMALTIVDCKQQVSFTQRVATVEAGYQAVIVDEYADELFAQRELIDEQLAASKQLLVDHGYAVPEV